MGVRKRKRLYRIVLSFDKGVTCSVFERARTRYEAERRALRHNPNAIGIDHQKFPQS